MQFAASLLQDTSLQDQQVQQTSVKDPQSSRQHLEHLGEAVASWVLNLKIALEGAWGPLYYPPEEVPAFLKHLPDAHGQPVADCTVPFSVTVKEQVQQILDQAYPVVAQWQAMFRTQESDFKQFCQFASSPNEHDLSCLGIQSSLFHGKIKPAATRSESWGPLNTALYRAADFLRLTGYVHTCCEAQGGFVKSLQDSFQTALSDLETLQASLAKAQSSLSNGVNLDLGAMFGSLQEQAKAASDSLNRVAPPLSSLQDSRLLMESASLASCDLAARSVVQRQKQLRSFWIKRLFSAVSVPNVPPAVSKSLLDQPIHSGTLFPQGFERPLQELVSAAKVRQETHKALREIGNSGSYASTSQRQVSFGPSSVPAPKGRGRGSLSVSVPGQPQAKRSRGRGRGKAQSSLNSQPGPYPQNQVTPGWQNAPGQGPPTLQGPFPLTAQSQANVQPLLSNQDLCQSGQFAVQQTFQAPSAFKPRGGSGLGRAQRFKKTRASRGRQY